MITLPKPFQIKKKPGAVRVFKDGREVVNLNCKAGHDEYELRKRLMWERQGKRCFLCGLGLSWADSTFEHQDGRGMGGAKRDDRIVKDGGWYNGVAHLMCNARKGSMSLERFIEMERL